MDSAGTLRRDADRIFRAAVAAVEPRTAVRAHLVREGDRLRAGAWSVDLGGVRRVLVVGAGKAGGPMALAVEEILAERIAAGLVVVKTGHLAPTRRVALHEAGHPIPDASGIAGAERILALARSAGADDLVVVLISGGGSALLPLPADGIRLADKQEVTRLLLRSGATIQEVNAVRKHVSRIKGGRLAEAAAPARVLTLVMSDVVGDALDAIASGPTVPDETTYAGALEVLRRYALLERVPAPVRARLEAGAAGRHPETPKPADACFARCFTRLVASNRLALAAARREAEALGYRALVLSSGLVGETREVAQAYAAIAREVREAGQPVAAPACIIAGGETTVTFPVPGGEPSAPPPADARGGRCQEFALAAAAGIAGLRDVVVASLGTDGTDGPTDAAGAFADGTTCARARGAGLDPRRHLEGHASYGLFDRLGDLIRTGPTNTNVMDLHLLLVGA
jgi:hydroxypyruvate reductase